MNDVDFIVEARTNWNDKTIETVLEACEANYLNGIYDDVSGDVEAPCGHFYIIERWIVVTDSQGFTNLHWFDNREEAEKAFEKLDEAYAEWDNEPTTNEGY